MMHDIEHSRAIFTTKRHALSAPARVARDPLVEQFVALRIGLEGDNPTAVAECSQQVAKLTVVGPDVEDAVYIGDAEKLLQVGSEGIGDWPPHNVPAVAPEELVGAGC